MKLVFPSLLIFYFDNVEILIFKLSNKGHYTIFGFRQQPKSVALS